MRDTPRNRVAIVREMLIGFSDQFQVALNVVGPGIAGGLIEGVDRGGEAAPPVAIRHKNVVTKLEHRAVCGGNLLLKPLNRGKFHVQILRSMSLSVYT